MRTYIIKVDNELQLMKVRKYFKECRVTQDLEVATKLIQDNRCCIQILDDKIKYVDKYASNFNKPVIQYASWLRRRNYDKADKKLGNERVVKELKQVNDEKYQTFNLFTKNARYDCSFNKVWKINVIDKSNNKSVTEICADKKVDKSKLLLMIRKIDKELITSNTNI